VEASLPNSSSSEPVEIWRRDLSGQVQASSSGRFTHLGAKRANIAEPKVIGDDLALDQFRETYGTYYQEIWSGHVGIEL
jgi:hypothetical protein